MVSHMLSHFHLVKGFCSLALLQFLQCCSIPSKAVNINPPSSRWCQEKTKLLWWYYLLQKDLAWSAYHIPIDFLFCGRRSNFSAGWWWLVCFYLFLQSLPLSELSVFTAEYFCSEELSVFYHSPCLSPGMVGPSSCLISCIIQLSVF